MQEIIRERIKDDYFRVSSIVNKLNISEDEKYKVLESVDLLIKDIKDNTKMLDDTQILDNIDFI